MILHIIQPHGYRQQLEQAVQLHDGNTDFEVPYQLLEEGRCEGRETYWDDRRTWPVGEYQFTAHVDVNQGPSQVIHTSLLVGVFFVAGSGKGTVSLVRPQFLECARLGPIIINHDEAMCQPQACARVRGRCRGRRCGN